MEGKSNDFESLLDAFKHHSNGENGTRVTHHEISTISLGKGSVSDWDRVETLLLGFPLLMGY